MGRRIKLWYSPGSGCAVCGSSDKGNLASPGFLSFGNLLCGPCLVVAGKYDPPLYALRAMERLGHLEHSRRAFREHGLAIHY